jgi:hypothetical protein
VIFRLINRKEGRIRFARFRPSCSQNREEGIVGGTTHVFRHYLDDPFVEFCCDGKNPKNGLDLLRGL